MWLAAPVAEVPGTVGACIVLGARVRGPMFMLTFGKRKERRGGLDKVCCYLSALYSIGNVAIDSRMVLNTAFGFL